MLDKLKELPDSLSRGVDDIFPFNSSEDSDQSFIKRLELSSIEKKPLRVKLGIDPTGTDIHIGHSILFRKLRACLLYTSPSPRDLSTSRMPSSA